MNILKFQILNLETFIKLVYEIDYCTTQSVLLLAHT